jgi:hypothetical protein
MKVMMGGFMGEGGDGGLIRYGHVHRPSASRCVNRGVAEVELILRC